MLDAFHGSKAALRIVQGHCYHTQRPIVVEAIDRVILFEYIPRINASDNYAFILKPCLY